MNDINNPTKSLEEQLKLKEKYRKSVRSKPQMKKKAIIYALTIITEVGMVQQPEGTTFCFITFALCLAKPPDFILFLP